VTYAGPDRVRAISVYGMVMGLAAVSGQLIGGVLIDANVAGLGPGLTMRFGRRVIATGAVVGALGDLLVLLAVVRWGTGGPLAALFPGLFLLGAGQGLCITPLTTTVLSHADASTAGSVSGALSTAQQVGNAIGVAVSGVIFYGLLSHGYRAAFGSSVAQMGCLLLAVAALTLSLLRPAATATTTTTTTTAEG